MNNAFDDLMQHLNIKPTNPKDAALYFAARGFNADSLFANDTTTPPWLRAAAIAAMCKL